MFSVIISEKGGAERRESFDRTEINVGRVQGNDLMLPKGNVSKRHARLLYRDGRFIVTDLKSTNGTYVNGRKIAQATIVREGDKIYIGDFVLRIESEAGAAGQAPGVDDSSGGGELAAEQSNPQSSPSPSSAEKAMRAPAPRIEAKPEEQQGSGKSADVISHFPLEHAPDASAPAAYVPAPPRVPTGTTRGPNPATKPSGAGQGQGGPPLATVTGMNAPPAPVSPIAPVAPIAPIAPIAP